MPAAWWEMGNDRGGESREGVPLTNLDEPLFDDASATKRDLVDYLDAMGDRIIPGLHDRPLSVIRARPGQAPFMALVQVARPDHPTHLVLDLDPPEGASFPAAVAAARLVGQALADVGLEGAVKTSGAKGIHVFVPLEEGTSFEDAAAATHTALKHLGDRDPWAEGMPSPQPLSSELVEEGRGIPVARVQAMHEGKRRARARREEH